MTAQPTTRRARPRQAGFTLIELLVVVTIVGMLAGLAVVQVKFAQRKARENVLKSNLHSIRTAIDNFYADTQRYPNELNELVPNYLRKIPADPMTQAEDWEIIMSDPTDEEAADPDPEAMTQPGVIDVKSTAEGTTLDGVAYTEL